MSTKRIKLLTVLIAVLAAALITFAGCKIGGDTAQDTLDKNGLTARVIYYANGGKFNNEKNIRSVFYKPDTPVLNIAQEGYLPVDDANNKYPKNVYVSYTNYVLSGWEYAELDDNDNPVFSDDEGNTLKMHVFTEDDQDIEFPKDEYGNDLVAFDDQNGEMVFASEEKLTVKSSGRAVDFTKKIGDGERWYFVANWVPDVRLNYVLVSDETVKIGDNEYNSGDVITQVAYGKGNSVNVASYAPASSNATYLQAFSDSECKNSVSSVAKPNDGNDTSVYVKYISGIWDIVKDPLGVSNMFSNIGVAGKRFYLFNDVNCSTISVSASTSVCRAEIAGNGYTLSNLKVSASGLRVNSEASLFGKLSETAKIYDLKLENLEVKLETVNNTTVTGLFMFCNGIEEGAVLSGLELKNSTFIFGDAAKQTVIGNIPYSDGKYAQTNWMFGGLGTDAAFIDKYGVKVNGYTLKVVINSIKGETETLVTVEAV